MSIAQTIQYLKGINPECADQAELIENFRLLGGIPICTMKIQAGRSIYRARFHRNRETLYTLKHQISYRTDTENITEFGRANLPGESQFYGSISSGAVDQGYVISVFETSGNLRNDIDGVERFTFSQWIVEDDLEVIVLGSEQSREKEAFAELHEYYDRFLEDQENSVELSNFYGIIGNEFSKKVPTGSNNNYKISAVFSHVVLNVGAIGIAYPSVQADHKGFNVVLQNDIVDNHLRLDKVCIADLHKRGNRSAFSQLKYAIAENDMFENYTDLEEPYNFSPETIERILNGELP
ncbi:MAG: hypothetical protein RIE58_01345 [Vicingaceae bacterium]